MKTPPGDFETVTEDCEVTDADGNKVIIRKGTVAILELRVSRYGGPDAQYDIIDYADGTEPIRVSLMKGETQRLRDLGKIIGPDSIL